MAQGYGRFITLAAGLAALNLGAWWWFAGGSTGTGPAHSESAGETQALGEMPSLPARPLATLERVLLPPEADRLVIELESPEDWPETAVDASSWPERFTIDPPLRGDWVSTSRDRAEFRFAAPPEPGTSITVRVREDAPDILVSEQRADVPGVRLSSVQVTAMTRQDVTLELRTDRAVDPAWLQRSLRLRAPDGRALEMEAGSSTESIGDRHVVRFGRPQGGRVRVDLDGRTHVVHIPVRFTALGAPWVSAISGEPSSITLRFTDVLADDVPFGAVTVEPAVENLRWAADGESVTMTGLFEPETTYRVTFPGALASQRGERLESELSVSVTVHPPSPSVRFPDGSGLLSMSGHGHLALESVGVQEIELTVYRVHDDLLVPFLRGLSTSDSSRRVLSRSVVLVSDADAGRHPRSRAMVDLVSLLGDARGLFVVEAQAAQRGWSRARTIVARTDLAAAVRTDASGAMLWVGDVTNAAPREGVRAQAMGPSGRVLAEGVTDSNGLLRIPVNASHPDGPLTAVLVRDGDDALLQRVDRGGDSIAAETDGGRAAPRGLDVLLYADRGVHRPGETLRMTALVRTEHGEVPDDLPLRFTLKGPDGRLIAEAPATARRADGGFVHADLPTLPAGMTGVHRVLVRVAGSDRVLSTIDAPVEPFVPASLLVTGTSDRLTPEQGRVRVRAERIGGRAASGLRVRMQAEFRSKRPEFTSYAGYLFGEPPVTALRAFPVLEETLDEEGRVEASWRMPDDVASAELRVTATVLESGGRSRSAVLPTVSLLRNAPHVGLMLSPGKERSDSAGSISAVVVDSDGAPVITHAPRRLRVERVRWEWGMEMVRGEPVWRSVERRTEVHDALLPEPIDSESSHAFPFDTPDLPPGEYIVTLFVGDARASMPLRVTPEGFDMERSREPDRVEITLAGTAPEPGGIADLLLRTPFAGTALITVEDDSVHAAHVRLVPEGSSRIEIPLPQTLRGGTFVSVLLVRGVDNDAESWRPHRAVGGMRLPIDLSSRRLDVALNGPARVRPGESVTVHLQADGNLPDHERAMMHVWAVDEGVIRAVHHVPVSPIAHYFGDRWHRVRHHDAWRRLLPDHKGLLAERTIGGDRDEQARRRGPESAFAESIVVFHRAVPLSSSGEGSIEFTMPDVDGALRVRAVVAAGDHYGSAESLIVADHPLRLIAHAPRVLAPGDRAMMTLRVVAGETFSGGSVTLSAQFMMADEDPSEDAEPMVITLGSGEERLVTIPLSPETEGRLIVSLHAHSEEVSADRRIEIPVRYPKPVERKVQLVRVPSGSAFTVPAAEDPETERFLRVLPSPQALLDDLIEQLIEYPYGCAEQTVHRLWALSAAERFDSRRAQQSGVLIDEGMQRLIGMQRTGGGIGYWPGEDEDPACTILAALLVSQWPVHERHRSFTEGLRAALIHLLERAGSGPRADTLRAHALRALGAIGAPQSAWTDVVAHRSDGFDAEALAQLGLAALAAGRGPLAHRLADRASAEWLAHGGSVPADQEPFRPGLRTVWTAASALDALLAQTRPEDPLREQLARMAEEAVSAHLSTVNAAAVLTILSSAFEADRTQDSAITEGTLRVEQQGEALSADHMMAEWHSAPSVRVASDAPITIAFDARGETAAGMLRVQITDVRPSAAASDDDEAMPDASSLLRLVRRWTDEEGEPLTLPISVESGDRVYVELELRTLTGTPLFDVAIVDFLPGGFEIEHPGLAGTAPGGGVHLAGASRAEIHDDRMLVFADVRSRPVTVRYAIRAVVPGRYALPPAEGEAMYDPLHRAVTSAGMVEVRSR